MLAWLFKNEFNKAWSEEHYHELHPELEDVSISKKYKQVKRVFRYGDMPDNPGIYLIRDTYKNNIYVGQTYDQGLRTRLSQHFRQRGSKALSPGIMYVIRWAETLGGKEMPKIAEALAVLHFKPEGNDHKDWRGNLKRAYERGLTNQILGEAKRLGFLKSGKTEAEYLTQLLRAIGK